MNTASSDSPTSQPEAAVSSSYRPEGQPATAMGQPVLAPRYQAQPTGYVQRTQVRPFSALAVQIKVGAGGPGLDLAVPLASRLNLRAGGSYFSYSNTFNVNGMDIDGKLLFRTADLSLDIFPFGNGFRISPGVTVYNGNHLRATMTVPAGQTFTLNDVDYTSSPTDPIRGDGSATFGEQTAPRFTIGWGNMIPRNGRHWSVPFELGFEYIQEPKVTMNLYGTACSFQDGENGCAPLQTDPTAQANLAAEIKKINNDIEPLRFYPVLSVGFAWSFNLRH